MDLHETFESHRNQIRARVLSASETMSLHTEVKHLASGALIITQPASAVALTPSQVAELMAAIGKQVAQ